MAILEQAELEWIKFALECVYALHGDLVITVLVGYVALAFRRLDDGGLFLARRARLHVCLELLFVGRRQALLGLRRVLGREILGDAQVVHFAQIVAFYVRSGNLDLVELIKRCLGSDRWCRCLGVGRRLFLRRVHVSVDVGHDVCFGGAVHCGRSGWGRGRRCGLAAYASFLFCCRCGRGDVFRAVHTRRSDGAVAVPLQQLIAPQDIEQSIAQRRALGQFCAVQTPACRIGQIFRHGWRAELAIRADLEITDHAGNFRLHRKARQRRALQEVRCCRIAGDDDEAIVGIAARFFGGDHALQFCVDTQAQLIGERAILKEGFELDLALRLHQQHHGRRRECKKEQTQHGRQARAAETAGGPAPHRPLRTSR